MNVFKKLKKDEAVEFVTHLINFTNMRISYQNQSEKLSVSKIQSVGNTIEIRKKLEKLKIDLLFSDKENTPYIYKSRLNKICGELKESFNEKADLYKIWKVSGNI